MACLAQVGGDRERLLDREAVLAGRLLEESESGQRLPVNVLGLEQGDHFLGQTPDVAPSSLAQIEDSQVERHDGGVVPDALADEPVAGLDIGLLGRREIALARCSVAAQPEEAALGPGLREPAVKGTADDRGSKEAVTHRIAKPTSRRPQSCAPRKRPKGRPPPGDLQRRQLFGQDLAVDAMAASLADADRRLSGQDVAQPISERLEVARSEGAEAGVFRLEAGLGLQEEVIRLRQDPDRVGFVARFGEDLLQDLRLGSGGTL